MPQSDPRHHRLLIIRFSSFGDIVQAIGVPTAYKARFPGAKVDWLVREDFAGLLTPHPAIDHVERFSRHQGFWGLLRTAWRLSGQRYTHLYDAHSNLRSLFVVWTFCLHNLLHLLQGQPRIRISRRPKQRLRRWLFFKFRLPVLPRPFRGADSYHRPLLRWKLEPRAPDGAQFFINTELPPAIQTVCHEARGRGPVIALAPSAAWKMKRWPIAHWRSLLHLMPEGQFLLLGGPEDHFLKDLEQVDPDRVRNFAGQLTLAQSSSLLKQVDLVIANDTGLLHVADQMARPTIALIGPTAFGYPSHSTSRTLEIELSCKPCSKDGRGRCENSIYQRCLVELSPERVAAVARELLKVPHDS